MKSIKMRQRKLSKNNCDNMTVVQIPSTDHRTNNFYILVFKSSICQMLNFYKPISNCSPLCFPVFQFTCLWMQSVSVYIAPICHFFSNLSLTVTPANPFFPQSLFQSFLLPKHSLLIPTLNPCYPSPLNFQSILVSDVIITDCIAFFYFFDFFFVYVLLE